MHSHKYIPLCRFGYILILHIQLCNIHVYFYIWVCVYSITHRACSKANKCLHIGHHKRRCSRIYTVLFYWKDLFFAPLKPQTSTSTLLVLLVRKAMKAAYLVEKKGFKTLSIFRLTYSATNLQRRLQRTPWELQASVTNYENVQLKDTSPG